jgi:hypothetical protein
MVLAIIYKLTFGGLAICLVNLEFLLVTPKVHCVEIDNNINEVLSPL